MVMVEEVGRKTVYLNTATFQELGCEVVEGEVAGSRASDCLSSGCHNKVPQTRWTKGTCSQSSIGQKAGVSMVGFCFKPSSWLVEIRHPLAASPRGGE